MGRHAGPPLPQIRIIEVRVAICFDIRVRFRFPLFVLLGLSLWLKKLKKSCCSINVARIPQPFLRRRYGFGLSHVNDGR